MSEEEQRHMEAEVLAMRIKNQGLEEELRALKDGFDPAKQAGAAAAAPPKPANPQVELLRQQLGALQDSLVQVTEELGDAKRVAQKAQDAAVQAQKMRQDAFVEQHMRPAEELREKFASHGQLSVLQELSDATVLSIAAATLTWAVRHKLDTESESNEPAEKVAMEGMIAKHQKDLEKMRSAVAQQEEKEKSLKDYLENQVDKTGKAKHDDAKKKLQDQLQKSLAVESELQKSFQESAGIGQQIFELKSLLHPLKERLDKVDRQTAKLQERQTKQEVEEVRLTHLLASLLQQLEGDEERLRDDKTEANTTSEPAQQSLTDAETAASAADNVPAPPGQPSPPPPPPPQVGGKRPPAMSLATRVSGVQTQVSLADALEAEARCKEQQSKVADLEAAKQELQAKCRAQLQDVRSKLRYLQEKYWTSRSQERKVTADEEDVLLRPLEPNPDLNDDESGEDRDQKGWGVPPTSFDAASLSETPMLVDTECASSTEDQQGEDPEALADAGAGAGFHHISAFSAGEFSGMLYTQKIEELEVLRAGLEHDVELLKETEQMLRHDCMEKDAFITELMRKVASEEIEMQSRARAQSRKKPSRLRFLRRERKGLQSDYEDLQHEAEEAMLDNIRLKNNLRMLAR
eukprot:CAMPEP_0178376072 /NCGR_PEP_ID=MMETSP0689_2-20121128/3214_1 /TAXON_ID=160604 /ORGANISM="Amphidinium massartii, Strain CS-259" /LENGTH=632 /DNA_ID=CAMNT_0019996083 /DNA_START=52 /DNA_END=1947 /DNA_ORIENTATION=+